MDEKKLSRYIDELNTGRRPKEHKASFAEEESEDQKLLATVRKVRLLREIEYPEDFFEHRLVNSLTGGSSVISLKQPVRKKRKHILFYSMATVAAAAILIFVTIYQVLPNQNPSIVYAMEKAMKEIQSYHGMLEVSETNELGETITQSKREVWADRSGNYYIKELEGTSQGLITVNNGEQKWQQRPEEAAIYLFSAFPDDYRFTFELGNEVNDVTEAKTVNLMGTEMISGRNTTKLQIIPDGGAAYYLWVDNETDLPLKKVSAMQNSIQIQVTYTFIEFMDRIPEKLLAYELPKDYKEVDTNQEQIVASLEEAEDVVGFIPRLPKQLVRGYTLDRIAVEEANSVIKFYYVSKDKVETILLSQSKIKGKLELAATAILGSVNHNKAGIITAEPNRSIRWQEEGLEYELLGAVPIEQLTAFAKNMTGGEVVIPDPTKTVKEPQIKVKVDQSVEENEQKSVDGGHSPWKLDPVFVAQVFASLLLSPEGIVGDYPIAYEDIEIIENNGTDAIAKIEDEKSIAKYVYLKRLVRQDDTGIWTVIGYDTK
jgi:outer membrane lipoprotein-sorting protein